MSSDGYQNAAFLVGKVKPTFAKDFVFGHHDETRF
jgi:hypothetical protein